VIYLQLAESIATAGQPLPGGTAFLEVAAQETLNHAAGGLEGSLSLVLSDDAQLQALNRQFLGIDAPTDVLSFPSGESEPDPDSGERYLGDVLISYPRARAQAEAGRHPVEEELRLLVVHGVLHLLGYDHTGQADKAEMWAHQAAILARLGSILRPPED
jgi:probable rRNA maturation factor